MEPISLAASVIAVATLAAQVCASISELRSLCKRLPGRLHAVNNEVADLELVLSQVALLIEERAILPDSQNSAIPHLLRQARTKLEEVRVIINDLTNTYVRSKVSLLGVKAWQKEQGRLQTLQDDIRTVKSTLNIMLGASNSYVLYSGQVTECYELISLRCRQDMMRIRLEVQQISAVTTYSSQKQITTNEKYVTTLAGIDERISRVEEMLIKQSQQLQASQFKQVKASYNAPPQVKRRPSSIEHENHSSHTQVGDLNLRVTPYIVSCRVGCKCACHSHQRSSTPALLNNVLGRLFVEYAGLPVFSPRCDDEICKGAHARQLSLEYWFPSGIWSGIVRMQMGFQLNSGPTLQLETLRRIPDSAQGISFALHGDIDGLKHLFSKGLASPRDISTGRGYSLLRWALYGKQYETCEFLIRAGADPNYRPIAASDNSPRIKACHFLLEGGLSTDAVRAMRTITRGSEYLEDFIDDSEFTKTHKIVLGLSAQDLEEQVNLHPEELNLQDAMGRTALAWAAARGDQRSVVTILSYGADPNITDVQLSGPLSNAAAQGHTLCVQLLLEAGADPEPVLPSNIRKGSPLNVAARNTNDPILLKRLLDFGADVDQSSTDGKTALFHAARNDNASFAILLLEYGANINAISATGETPLTTAITYNSHNVLRLFLERWREYSTCPRLKGPHLLEFAALYANLETITILQASIHIQSNHDKQYVLRDFSATLRQRQDMTEKLALAFDELLSVLSAAPCPRSSQETLSESGSFLYLQSHTPISDIGPIQDVERGSDSEDSFHDTLSVL